ncbi:hypothetical protein UM93_04665 [Psychromicrobium lacuslunae]|uniref:Shikimate kinase n=1 Tax=Psychromicrobium lacuslunae TaxID=1618207 RepID=A0A0D4C2W3_9MICC|nr:hypothetical protein UM93_04665 [Psychromicrobium lacuslunae]
MPNSIVLIGPMAVGKTTLGLELARQLGRDFIDSDQQIENQHGKIAEIFASRGEAWFRQVEARCVAQLLAQSKPFVLSLGGGAVLDTGTQQLLSAHTVVYLSASSDHVRARLLRSTNRPLLQSEDPVARWEKLLKDRACVYQRLADLTLEIEDHKASELARLIIDQLSRTVQGESNE